ncbi:MAG: ribosomal protein S1p, partial [Myxococcaceae bacterium]|nr:ribosomal protein S1p [Myxococcaceae bacterium]
MVLWCAPFPMNPSDSPDNTTTDSPSGEAAPQASAPVPVPDAAASPTANGSHSESQSDDQAGAATAAEGEATPGGGGASPAGAAGAGVEGAAGPAKKRRRRRRKGKGPHAEGTGGEHATGEGAEAADGEAHEGEGEGASAEGAAAGAGPAGAPGDRKKQQRPKKERPPRESRERPAFNVGDVVFGKIIEVSDDAIFVDLSGKGRGVFDKLELLLPEDQADEVEADARRAEAEAEAILADKPAGTDGSSDANEPGEGQALTPDGVVEAPPTLGEGEAAPAAVEAAEAKPAEVTRRVVVAPAVVEAAAAAEAAQAADAAADAEPATLDETPRDTLIEGVPAVGTDEAPAPEPGVIQLPRVVLEPGAPFVGVVHNDGGRGGLVVLTHHPKRASRAKPAVAAALKNHTEILGLVTGVIKGGVEVDVDGIRAFAPGSHMDIRLGADLHPLVGKRLSFHVTQYGKRGRDVVLSRRAMLEKESKAAREAALQKITPGE